MFTANRTHSTAPLAARVRPQTLAEVIGQRHLLGDGAPLAQMVANQFLPSIILHGQTGIGKTTLARLLADAVGRKFVAISAINSGVKELKEAISADKSNLFFAPKVVFVDEIHKFNKSQQDTLLAAAETGDITLIGATSENPSFAVNNALLSRCQVYRLLPFDDNEIAALIHRAVKTDTHLANLPIKINALDAIAQVAMGDGRRALNLLELVVQSQINNQNNNQPIIVDNHTVQTVAGQAAFFDKNGDLHFDMISALIKSVRGSDPNAALYWLARLLVAGADPAFLARRLVILASEDIGLANPNALLLAHTALQSVESIGMPEARIILAQAAVYMATSAKSNSSYKAINAAMAFAQTNHAAVPNHLKNAPTQLAKSEGFGEHYRYTHDYPNHYCAQQFMPDGLEDMRFYDYGDNQKEQQAAQYWQWVKAQNGAQ